MKTRALGFLLMVAAAGVYAVGCGSSNNNTGTGGAGGSGTGGAGTGGKGGSGMGGAGTGGAGMGGKMDAGNDTVSSMGGKMDAGSDTPTDTPMDTQTAPTFTQVFAIISDFSTDTSPGCARCHDGVIADGGTVRLPHSMNLANKAAAYAALVGVNSQRCAGSDAGADASAALKRVLANNADQSVIVQKLKQGLGMGTACDGIQMPLQVVTQIDGGADAGDAGSTSTHYAISPTQLQTIEGWINAGALDN